MKRALKKRVKAVLKNTPNNDDAPVEQLNIVNPRVNRRVRTKAAMIGLAISMGATSLLVTRQSDQAQAAAPVGSQQAASSLSAAPDTQVKFAPTTLGTTVVSSASVPENPVIVEPTAISQLPGLDAKWQVAASGMSVQVTALETLPQTTAADRNSINQQLQIAQGVRTTNQLGETAQQLPIPDGATGGQTTFFTAQSQTQADANSEVNTQLKAQQEFALNRLQEKSNRLRKSLAELRSEKSKSSSQTATVVDQLPQTSANNTTTEQSPSLNDPGEASPISSLKQTEITGTPMQQVPTTPKVVASSDTTAYEVKPGDTLAAIASRYNTSVSELVKANSLSNPNQLQISQKLIIPAAQVNSKITAQKPVVINSTSVHYTSPVNTPNTDRNLSVASQLSVPTNNSITIPTSAAANNQMQANTGTKEIAPTTPDSYGVGGDTPVPTAFADMQASKKPAYKVASTKNNERLHSLQDEIKRLQAKYRAQQSGNVATVPAVSEGDNAAVPISVTNQDNFAVSRPVSRSNNFAVPISVPRPMAPGYSTLPIQPQFRATSPTSELINPEFLPNGAPGQLTPSRNIPVRRMVTPPNGVSASDSLGKMRGTNVSPSFPPLAAVDQYLPRAIDETIPPPSNSSSVAYIWPAKGVLTSGFGMRWGRPHRGIDVANATGTPIYASSDGVIEKAGWSKGGYGNVVDIRHPDGSMTRYGHNSRILVQAGQQVRQGQTIAAMGSTGFSTGPHSHFEIHPSGKGAVNPIAMLPGRL